MKRNCVIPIIWFLFLAHYFLSAQSLPAYPQLTGVVFNGCDNGGSTPSCATLNGSLAGNCVEGRTEIAFFRAGTTAISAAAVQAMSTQVIQLYTTPWANCSFWSGSAMNYAAATTSLNSTGCGGVSCGTCFQDAWSTGIPAGATFMMVCGYFCVGTNDFTTLCGSATTSPIYVIYFGVETPSGTCGTSSSLCGAGTDGGWSASGNYTNYNATSSTKGISINMSSLVAGAPTLYYDYDVSLEANGNGAGAYYGAGGATTGTATSPTAYTSASCNLPLVLPVSLLNFSAKRTKDDGIEINWATAEEINSSYFELEYSIENGEYISYKKIKAAGNSNTVKNYNCLFTEEIGTATVYFRLKQVDLNGNFKYSNIISINNSNDPSVNVYFNSETKKIITKFNLDTPEEVNLILFDVSGNKIAEATQQGEAGANSLIIPAPNTNGVYFLVCSFEGKAPIRKKIAVFK